MMAALIPTAALEDLRVGESIDVWGRKALLQLMQGVQTSKFEAISFTYGSQNQTPSNIGYLNTLKTPGCCAKSKPHDCW